MTFRDRLVASWYAPTTSSLALALAPLALLFALAAAARRWSYRIGLRKATRVGVPVVVVGNVTVGGSGKTPLVAALAHALSRRGFTPGIVSRGYGRRESRPLAVTPASDAADVGDEPLLLARRGWPVVVATDRALAARTLLDANAHCDVIVSDDGLQHYALARDVEIAVVDGVRGVGNGLLLPAGPLREPRGRLTEVDAVVATGPVHPPTLALAPRVYAMTLVPRALRRVGSADTERPIAELAGIRVHAVAGIGNPDRFFDSLRALGLEVDAHRFADHHAFVASDLAFGDGAPVVMTEKDAVKCERFADAHCWYLPVDATIEPELVDRVVEKLKWTQSCSKSSSAR